MATASYRTVSAPLYAHERVIFRSRLFQSSQIELGEFARDVEPLGVMKAMPDAGVSVADGMRLTG